MKARITVRPRQGVLDPQGKAIVHSLAQLGWSQIRDIRVGKSFEVELDAASPEEARKILDEISRKLLANLVIEDFAVEEIR
jgi:phosphoribosylformylglycinamidine synthase